MTTREARLIAAVVNAGESISDFLIACKRDSDNYVGGIERLKLESALAVCDDALLRIPVSIQMQAVFREGKP